MGRLMKDAVSRVADDPTREVATKMFTFGARVQNSFEAPGTRLADYMRLPIEQYSLYDQKLMRRLGKDMFELRMPLSLSSKPRGSRDDTQPYMQVRVVPSSDNSSLTIYSVRASLLGEDADGDDSREEQRSRATAADAGNLGDLNDRPLHAYAPSIHPQLTTDPNVAPARDLNATRMLNGIGEAMRSARLNFSARLEWSTLRQGRVDNCTRLICKIRIQLSLPLPPPFTLVPRMVVQSAGGVLVRSVAALATPQFMNLLQADYGRWINGSRDLQEGVGTLMEEQTLLE